MKMICPKCGESSYSSCPNIPLPCPYCLHVFSSADEKKMEIPQEVLLGEVRNGDVQI